MESYTTPFFNLNTMIIQTILLLVILWVLNKFVFKPYLKFLDEQQEKRQKLESDYKNIDKLIADAEDKKEGILSDARKKSDEVISESESIANKKRQSIIEKAENDAKSIVDSSSAMVEKERLSMLSGVKSKLIDLILKFNGKLFDDEKISKEYIEKNLGTIK